MRYDIICWKYRINPESYYFLLCGLRVVFFISLNTFWKKSMNYILASQNKAIFIALGDMRSHNVSSIWIPTLHLKNPNKSISADRIWAALTNICTALSQDTVDQDFPNSLHLSYFLATPMLSGFGGGISRHTEGINMSRPPGPVTSHLLRCELSFNIPSFPFKIPFWSTKWNRQRKD